MRVPVLVGLSGEAASDDALLVEGEPGASAETDASGQAKRRARASFQPATLHAAGCTCCQARSPAAVALAGLLHARARGEVAFFRRVIAVLQSDAGRVELAAAMDTDPVVSACFSAPGPD